MTSSMRAALDDVLIADATPSVPIGQSAFRKIQITARLRF